MSAHTKATSGDYAISRRGFLKLGGAAAAAAVAGPSLAGKALASEKAGVLKPGFQSKFSVCDMCFNKCSLIARVQDGVVQKLDPNPKFLKSRGMLCAKGNAGIRQLYDPNRLKHPLLRKGARGEGKWQRLSWDEALDLAAEKFKAIGDKYTRCGWLFMPGSDMQSGFVGRFAEAYGSYNQVSHESQCLIAGTRAFIDTFGEVPIPDMLYTKYVVMAGANRFESLITPDSMDLMTAMKNNGAKLVVLDPRYTKSAALADEWFAIRPGTDMAFMLALAHVMVTEGIYNKEFVENKTYGFDELAKHVRQYTPQWAEAETGIPAADIARIAREVAQAAPASMIYPGRRSSFYNNSTQIRRSYAIVNALLGNWDQPGGLTAARQIGIKSPGFEPPFYESNPDDRIDAHGAPMMFEHEGSFKVARDRILEGKPYPIKGWLTYKTNPMQTVANRAKTIKMINSLEFMISIDIVMSDTAWMADLVLPSQCYLERTDPISPLQGSSACACAVMRDPVVPGMYEAKPVFWMMQQIAKRLKLGEFFDFSIEEYRKEQVKELPDAMEALLRDGVYYNPSKLYGVYEGKIYKTSSHKVDIYNKRYLEMGLDPLPVYTPPNQPKDKGQFRLVVGRNALITQSSSTNNSLLAEFQPTNHLWLNPERAAELGIADGDLVKVTSPVGVGRLRAKVAPGIRPDTTYMETGFGVLSPRLANIYGKGAAIGALIIDDMDKISGNMAMHETFVTVEKEAA